MTVFGILQHKKCPDCMFSGDVWAYDCHRYDRHDGPLPLLLEMVQAAMVASDAEQEGNIHLAWEIVETSIFEPAAQILSSWGTPAAKRGSAEEVGAEWLGYIKCAWPDAEEPWILQPRWVLGSYGGAKTMSGALEYARLVATYNTDYGTEEPQPTRQEWLSIPGWK